MCDCEDNIQTGLDGYNAYTKLTAAFTMPAEGANGTAYINSDRPLTNEWCNIGQKVNILGSTLEVISKSTGSIVLKNLANTSTGEYLENAAPTTIFPSLSGVSPGGDQGPRGLQGIPGNNSGAGIIYFKADNSIESDTYTQLDSITVTDLVNNNDCIEIESIVRYPDSSTCTLEGYKFQVNGVDTHEYTSTELIDATDIKYVIHKASITRVSNILLNINSVIYVTDSGGSLNNIANNQSFVFTSPATTNAASTILRFLLQNDVPDIPITQVVLQVKYLPAV